MTIGIDVSRILEAKKTGVEWYVWHLLNAMKEEVPAGVRVLLYTPAPLNGALGVLPENWEECVLSWPPKRLWTQIRLGFEMLRRPPNILFVPAHTMPLIRPKKTIMTVHDIAAWRFPESYNWFERWYSLFSARDAMKRGWRVIVPSDFTKQELIDYVGVPGEQVHVVPHGIDESWKKTYTDTQVTEILDTYGVQKPYILAIGRVEEKKNTRRLVEAFDQLKQDPAFADLSLVLVGKDGYGSEHVERLIENSQYKDDIIRPGWMEQHDLPILMHGARTFAYVSLYEGFGMPVLEAFAQDTPVVVAIGSSITEVGGDAMVCVDPLSVDAISNGLQRVLSDEELRAQLAARGRVRLREYSWARAARETWKVISHKS